jgi:hypothetical protein
LEFSLRYFQQQQLVLALVLEQVQVQVQELVWVQELETGLRKHYL